MVAEYDAGQAAGAATIKKERFNLQAVFVAHDRCAMKVGTDGILLGAWAPVAG